MRNKDIFGANMPAGLATIDPESTDKEAVTRLSDYFSGVNPQGSCREKASGASFSGPNSRYNSGLKIYR